MHIECSLCQVLAQLHPFLVVGVDIPQEALEHHLVLEVGKQRAQIPGCKPVAIEQRRGTVSREALVDIFIGAPFCKCSDLGGKVCIKLGLGGASA